MDDLVKRLRDREGLVVHGFFHTVPAMREAADRIEKLEAMLIEAKREIVDAIERSSKAYNEGFKDGQKSMNIGSVQKEHRNGCTWYAGCILPDGHTEPHRFYSF